MGYRGYDRAGIEPLFPFGHGLGYTTWCYESARATPSADGSVVLTVTVRNTGSRHGREVVQAPSAAGQRRGRPAAYAGRVHRSHRRARAERDGTADRAKPCVRTLVRARCGWIRPAGEHAIRIGRSSRDLPLTLKVNPATSSPS